MAYDTGGRLDTVTMPHGQVGYTYGLDTGLLVSINAPGGVLTQFGYDGSLMTSEVITGPVSGSVYSSVEYTYNNNFQVTSRSVNGGNTVGFTYDNDGLLLTAGALGITYNAQNGLLTGTTVGGVTDTLGYNTFGEVTGYAAQYSGGDVFATTYTRDKLGRVTGKTETIGGVTDTYVYTYDLAGRLTDVEKNTVLVGHYEYDQNSNRTSYTGDFGMFGATYDAQDRLLIYGTNSYTYTQNGELATKTNASGVSTYSYDVSGNLRSAGLADGTQIDYIIDGRNRRIGKKVNGVLVQGFIYGDQLNPIVELDGAGTVVATFTGNYMVKGGTTYRIISDHLGSPRLVVDVVTGAVVQEIAYDEFGNVLNDTNPGFQPFGFAGGIFDQHTKLTRFGARDYDAQTGRWTAKDPIGFNGGDTNLYGYVLNDPVNLVDPSGEFALVITPVVIAAAVTVAVAVMLSPPGREMSRQISEAVVASLESIYLASKENIKDSGISEILERMRPDYPNQSYCFLLDLLMEVAKAACDKELIQKIKKYQKALGCRRNRHSGNKKK